MTAQGAMPRSFSIFATFLHSSRIACKVAIGSEVQIDDMIRHVSTMRRRAKTSEVGLAFMWWILASRTEDASGKIRK